MIFKHLFRSKHQNPNPQVRIQGIQNLNTQDPQQKSILHELAFNDSDANVSLAALDKLDSFALWYKMAEIAKNERVQKRSQKMVEEALLSANNQTLDNAEKRKFVLECRDNKLIEKLLGQGWIQQDTELAMQLVQRMDKSSIQEKLLLESQNESLRLAILSTLEDGPQPRKLLNRLLKKEAPNSVKQQAKDLLAQWLAAEEKPQALEQKVTMVLSRLLALKDSNDFTYAQQQNQSLCEQYQELQAEFDCFSEVKRQQLNDKYSDISGKVTRALALLKPVWEQAQAEQQRAEQVQNMLDTSQGLIDSLKACFDQGVANISDSQKQDFAKQVDNQISALVSVINQVPAANTGHHKQLEALHQTLLTQQNTLAQLPAFQQAIQTGTEIVSKFEALDLPTDHSQVDAARSFATELKEQWRNEVAIYQDMLPEALVQNWRNRSRAWQQAIKDIQQQINQQQSRCRNKIRATQNLIQQGKFKAAMGLYQKVQVWYQALPEKAQSQLQRSFEDVKQEVENLQDWQAYIAAPRKPALLKEVEAIIAKPLAIDEQAKLVKKLRAEWNSLGKVDSESDQALNDAFDLAIEQAFAPCREHYQQQEKARQSNLADKQKILEQLTAIAQSEISAAELAKSLKTIQQKWTKIGKVDYKQQSKLHSQYQSLLTPLKERVNVFYLDNQEQKQKLVERAIKLSELESVDDAIEQVKQLQAQWKTVQHAGRKAESQLWSEFKQANDAIFAKRTEASKAQKQAIKLQVEQAKEVLDSMQQRLEQAVDKSQISQALEQKSVFEQMLQDLPKANTKGLTNTWQALLHEQQAKLSNLSKAHQSQQYQTLFNVLEQWQQAEVADDIKDLAKPWQQCFTQVDQSINRHKLTIQMEIVAKVDSPFEDASLRQIIQMELMANKLEKGEAPSLNGLLKDWIRAGQLQANEQALLLRIKPLFVNYDTAK